MAEAASQMQIVETDREQYLVTEEPYYRAVADEVENYQAAYQVRMPVMLKGPTGCGKSRLSNTWPGSCRNR
jgi:MoxR-like ATPase